jgi:hypothetical protein
MQSPTRSIWSQNQIGTQSALINGSKGITPMLPSLGFSRSAQNHSLWHRPMGRHDSWDAGPTYQREILRLRQISQARTSARRRLISNVLMVLATMGALFITAGVIEHEVQLMQRERGQ